MINFGYYFKVETEAEAEAIGSIEMIELETKSIVLEMNQIDNNNPSNASNGSPSSQPDFNSPDEDPSPGDEECEENTLDGFSFESNEMEVNERGVMLYKCRVCGKCDQRRWNFLQHMRTHSDERPFECPLCHKK